MHRFTLVATLVSMATVALAQGGDLAGVTMRVLDDLSALDAVILELDATSGESAQDAGRGREAAAGDGAEHAAPVTNDERDDTRASDNDDGEAPAVPPAR